MSFLGSSRTKIRKKCLNRLKHFCNKHCKEYYLHLFAGEFHQIVKITVIYCTVPVGYNDLEVLEQLEHLEKPFRWKIGEKRPNIKVRGRKAEHTAQRKLKNWLFPSLFYRHFFIVFFSPSTVLKSASNGAFFDTCLEFLKETIVWSPISRVPYRCIVQTIEESAQIRVLQSGSKDQIWLFGH